MRRRKRMSALLLGAAFLLTALLPVQVLAQPDAGTGGTFTVTVNLPESLEGESDITVLGGSIVQLIACYDGRYTAPQGTQFCWQYSTSGDPDSFNFLSPAPDDSSHISTNAVNVTGASGATWYRAVLETKDHQPAADFRPNESSVTVVRWADFLFSEPARAPEPLCVLPGAAVTLGPVAAENIWHAQVSYQWQQADGETWTDMEGATGTLLEAGDLEPGQHIFRCLASAAQQPGDKPRTIASPVYTVDVSPLTISGYTLAVNGTEEEMPADLAPKLDPGETASFTAVLSSPGQAAYQWQYAAPDAGWYDLDAQSGAFGYEAETLSVPVSRTLDGWRYRCLVTTQDAVLGGGPEDPVITLNVRGAAREYENVTPSPFIFCPDAEALTAELTVPLGMPVTLQAVNRSTPEIPAEFLRYTWESAPSAEGPFVAISGAGGSSLTTEAGEEARCLRCRVINEASGGKLSAVSNAVTIRAADPDGTVYFTEPLAPPPAAELRPGGEQTFAARARCDDGSPVAYTWQYARVGSAEADIADVPDTAWTNAAGADSAVFTARDLQAGHYFYRCLAQNADDPEKQAVSAAWKLSVVPLSPKPVVSPSAEMPGPDGTSVPRYIPVGVAAGGSAVLQCEAYIPSGDRIDYTWYLLPSGPGAEPELLMDSRQAVLELNDIPARYDACSFFCIASNRKDRTQQTRTGAWYLSVWPAGRQPEILAQPQPISASWDPADPEERLTVSVTAAGSTGAVLEKQALDGSWAASDAFELKKTDGDGTAEEGSASQTYSGSIPLNAASYLLNGTYRIRVDNGEAKPPGLPPCSTSEPFGIEIRVSGQPWIAAEPADANAAVGASASFAVDARVDPSGTPLTYCWQISEDGGATYRNCLPEDGTADGSSFSTVPLTEEMKAGEPRFYRCLTANSATGQQILSSSAMLTVLAAPPAPPVTGDPVITAADGSGLTVADGYITGLTATRPGTECEKLLAGLEAPEGYHVELRTAQGTPAAGSDPAATGMSASLVRDSDPAEIPVSLSVIVRGDVAGNGRLSIVQLTTMARALNGQKPLDGVYFVAGDFNGSGTIDVSDLVREAQLLNQAD